MRKIKTIKLAHLTDYSIDEIVEAHIKYVISPRTEPDEENSFLEETEDGKFPKWVVNVKGVEEGDKTPRKAILCHKYMFLLHIIITHCRNSRDGSTHLHYDTLSAIIGRVYGDMVRNLAMMGIIYLSDTYDIEVNSRTIDLLDWNIGFTECHNKVVIDYLDKLKSNEKERYKKIEKEIKSSNPRLIKKYNENLNRLEISDYDGALDYINSRTFKNEQSHQYYLSRIEDFESHYKGITRIDDRGRLYHFLTNCPRPLKHFFNLKYQLDIANSQPLLYCDFLIKEYDIGFDIILKIREIIDNNIDKDIRNNNNHNDCKQLCKLLKHSGLQPPNLKSIPPDVLLYIYRCMKGEFWDDFVDLFPGLDRGEVKENMFREVFYAYSRTMKHKEYGKAFAKVYPSVWKLIRSMRKDGELLCHRITKTESELFHKILEQCFERGWVVVSIHDAILVLDVPENNSLSIEDVRTVMLDVYREHCIIPTISEDVYN